MEQSKLTKRLPFFWLFCSLLLLVALLPLESDYYVALRWIVSIGALTVIASFLQKNWTLFGAHLVILTLFNPIVPIYLYHETVIANFMKG